MYEVIWKTSDSRQELKRSFDDMNDAENFYIERMMYKIEVSINYNNNIIESYTKADMMAEQQHKKEVKAMREAQKAKCIEDHEWWLSVLALHDARKEVIETVKAYCCKKHDAIADANHQWWQQLLTKKAVLEERRKADHEWWLEELRKNGMV